MFLTDPLRFFVFLVGIGMFMTVFQCDVTSDNVIDLEVACQSGSNTIAQECKQAGYW